MKKNMLKLVIATLLIMILSISYTMPYCYAAGTQIENDGGGGQSYKGQFGTGESGKFEAEKFKPDSTTQVENGEKLLEMANKAIGVVMSIASVFAVVTFAIIGIKYMLGSAEDKSQYKQTVTPYLIGAVLVFGITTVIKVIAAVAQNIPT